jgi:hypothetical protein
MDRPLEMLDDAPSPTAGGVVCSGSDFFKLDLNPSADLALGRRTSGGGTSTDLEPPPPRERVLGAEAERALDLALALAFGLGFAFRLRYSKRFGAAWALSGILPQGHLPLVFLTDLPWKAGGRCCPLFRVPYEFASNLGRFSI